MSLGLMTWNELLDMRFAELGRRDAESVTGGGEDLVNNFISHVCLNQDDGSWSTTHTTLNGERRPSESEGRDMFF